MGVVSRGTAALVFALGLALAAGRGRAQEADLTSVHDLAVHAIVRIQNDSAFGSNVGAGWLLQQTPGARPVVLTVGHVVAGTRTVEIQFYQGSAASVVRGTGRVAYHSRRIDLAVVTLDADPPPSARALSLEPGDLLRGQRVVLGGHPHDLPFQTTEGVVTGVMPDETAASARCGDGRNCVIVDAASFGGSSGGPALDRAGRVVGMLWAGPGSDSGFAFLIHVRTIEAELASIAPSH
jgi:S1-C subfamily serine protease